MNTVKPKFRMVGITFFEDADHAKYMTVPEKYRLKDEVYARLKNIDQHFSLARGGPAFTSLHSAKKFIDHNIGQLCLYLGSSPQWTKILVPGTVQEFLTYTGLDAYIKKENDDKIHDLPFEIKTEEDYYSKFTADRQNGPVTHLPIVINISDSELVGVIGTVGLEEVLGK